MLVDTPGLNPKDSEEIEQYAKIIKRMKPDRVIGVFPVSVRTSDLIDSYRAYHQLGLTELAFTMIDQTLRQGGLIALSQQSGLPIRLVNGGRGPRALDMTPHSRVLLREMLGVTEEMCHEN